MNYLKKHKRLIIFVLASIFILLVYDLFNEVPKQGDISGRILPRAYRMIILCVFSFYIFSRAKLRKSKFNNLFISIYSTIIIYMLLDPGIGFNTVISLSKLLYLVLSYLFFFNFYLFFNNRQTVRYLNIFVTLSVFILSFHIIGSRLNLIGGIKTYGNNNGYVLLSLLPLIYLNSSLKYRRILFFIIIVGVFLSLKRGAIVALFFCLLGSYFFARKDSKTNAINKIKKFFVNVLTLGSLFYIYSKFADIFIERFSDFSGDAESFGSGRGNVYSLIWNDWYESNNIITYLFGKGYDSVKVLTSYINGSGLMAHSDFFNFIHSYGLIGIFLLVSFSLHQLKLALRLYTLKNKLAIPYMMLFIIFFFKAIYSGNFESPNFIYLLIGFAFINASLVNLRIKN